MVRAEKVGLGVATAGHLLLFAILSLGLVTTARMPPPHVEPIDVQLVDLIGMRSAAPAPAVAPPAPSVAPEQAAPEDTAPPEPAPPPPKPTPAAKPPEPTPEPAPKKPAPEKPKPVVKPAPPPEPKPAETKPKPPEVKPKPEKAKAEKPVAEKPVQKAKAEKPIPAKSESTKASIEKTIKGLAAKADDEASKTGSGKSGSKAKSTGARLGNDFLKGISPDKTTAKAEAAPAAVVDARAMAGLAAAIQRQVQPCYELGSLAGTPAMQIVTVMRLRFNRDGSVVGRPELIAQTGVNDDNRAYAKQIEDIGRRAVLRCSPLRLPPELYEGGWDDFNFRFRPGQMQ